MTLEAGSVTAMCLFVDGSRIRGRYFRIGMGLFRMQFPSLLLAGTVPARALRASLEILDLAPSPSNTSMTWKLRLTIFSPIPRGTKRSTFRI